MLTMPQPPQIHLPSGWKGCVKSAVLYTAVLYTIALAHYSMRARFKWWGHMAT